MASNPIETETLPPEAPVGSSEPSGIAFPMPRPPQGMMMRRDVVVAGAIGLAAGVGLTLYVLWVCRKMSR